MNDFDFIKEKTAGESIDAPSSVSPENITAGLAGVRQKSRKKRIALSVSLPAAAALFLALAIFVLPNVQLVRKYTSPSGGFHTGNAESIGFTSYDDVAEKLKELSDAYKKDQKENSHYVIEYNGGAKYATDYAVDEDAVAQAVPAAVPEIAADANNNGASAGTERSFSETNVRESAVDEEDIIKTDGNYIYYLPYNEYQLYIIKADGSEMVLESKIDLSGRYEGSEYYDGLFLRGDTVVVTGTVGLYGENGRWDSFTLIRIFDVSDRTAPSELKSFRFEGHSAASSRLIGDKLIVVTCDRLDFDKVDPEETSTFVPCYYDAEQPTYVSAEDIILPEDTYPDATVSVSIIDLSDPAGAETETVSVFTSGGQVYCTTENLYIYSAKTVAEETSGSKTKQKEQTEIMSFDITGDKAVYKTTGTVDGYIIDSFAIDEYNGFLRLAVTEQSYTYYSRMNYYMESDWSTRCRVVTLDENLNKLGATRTLVEDEDIQSVRFMGDTAYVVTFRQTDPLFVIDLSDPAAPEIKGELTLPGFSAYLHPVGEGMIVGLGFGGNESGTDGSAKISLFDVSDPANPIESDSLIYKNSYVDSDYKCFVDMKDGSFLVNLTNYGDYYSSGSDNVMIRFGINDGKLIVLTEYDVLNDERSYSAFVRGLFIDDTVYAAVKSEYWDNAYDYVYYEEDYAEDNTPDEDTSDVLIADGYNSYQIEYGRRIFINSYDKDSGELTGSLVLYVQ
ncbi:MAG: beta-propeller domain-containing protein [Clostridia bacterium]|nr:beta-propeller domain-containing protein [Clostridia bacterium]